jgi:hypothetical protein
MGSKKQSKLQIDEILNFFTFLVNGHHSTSKVKVIIYQYFNVLIFVNTIPTINF